MKEITVEKLNQKLKSENIVVIDVREPFEYNISNIDGWLIPLNEIKERVDEIEEHKNDEVIVMCRTGGRSAEAVKILESQGFENVKNLKGGINEWAKKIDQSLPVY